METIHKYPLRCTGYAEAQILQLPAGAEILSVASMPHPDPESPVEQLQLWAKVETDNGLTERKVVVCGTGQPFAPYEGRLKYISTFCMSADRQTGTGHAFELILSADTEASGSSPPLKWQGFLLLRHTMSDMNEHRLRMLQTALGVVQGELAGLAGWVAATLDAAPSAETLHLLADADVVALFVDFDDALIVYAEARNSYASSEDLNVVGVTLGFSSDTFREISEAEESQKP